MRHIINLNQDWLYLPRDDRRAKNVVCDEGRFQTVCLPHANVELPWHNFDDQEYQFISWYRRHVKAPKAWRGKRLHLMFQGVMIAAEVWVNKRYVGQHKGGYTPFTLDITDAVNLGEDNVIAVRVDSWERKDIPPFGHIVDYLTFGGIYREVELQVLEPVHVADVFARPGNRSLEATIAVANEGSAARETEVVLKSAGKSAKATVIAPPHGREDVVLKLSNLAVEPWSLDNPNLYDVRVSLDNGDAVSVRVGFREAHFAKDGRFYLNGAPVKLMGLNRHQTFPYVGGAMPARVQRRDADILKHELGLNIVRTSHYPQSRHFLDRCDEIGLLVFEETPGWQHIGDDAWKTVSKHELREMILRDRNHPCIVLWGVRINESADDPDFYTETNRIAHELDPTRQTGGVRCHRESEFLEDVFTYNDFSDGVQEPNHCPYLITEFNGHMFPTKPFDQEERLVEHALRHARIQNAQMGKDGIAGAIGWCAFDYNTHKMFGSGDRVCYHGVMDMFRFPKFAAWFYKSQIDPRISVVLEPASYLKIGERSRGGFDPLVIFSNCDVVEAWHAGACQAILKPDRESFPHLPHPPFVYRNIGPVHSWAPYEFLGKIQGNIAVRKRVAFDGVPFALRLTADDEALEADGSDCTRIAFSIVDKYGNVLPYATGIVELTVAGPGSLIGENPFALVAGRGALWLRAGRRRGLVTVTARTARLKPRSVTVRLE